MFGYKRFIIGNILYALFNASFIYAVLTPFVRTKGVDPLQLSTLQTLESLFWFVFMYISGIIFDRFGAKISFLFGRIIDFISIIFLLNPTYSNLIMSYICIGISKGSIYGKYESYMYNYLSITNKLNTYPRTASVYYFFWDISLSMFAFISSLLLKNHDYRFLIYITLILKVVSLFSVIFFIQGNKTSELVQFKNDSIKQIFISVIGCIKKSSTFTYLLLFYGVLNFFTYPLCLTIGDMILVDMGWSGVEIAKYTSIFVALMAVGTFLPIIFLPKGIKIKYCLYLSLLQMVLMMLSAIIYSKWMFICSAIFIVFTFSLIEVSIEKHFERYSNKKIRGSAISLSISIGTLLRMFNVLLIGIIAKNYSYHIGLIFVVFPVLLLLILITAKLKHIQE